MNTIFKASFHTFISSKKIGKLPNMCKMSSSIYLEIISRLQDFFS